MNNPITILGIAGSLRRECNDRAALRAAKQLLPEGVTLHVFELDGTSAFNQDEEKNTPTNKHVRLATALALASMSAMVGCAGHNSSSMSTLSPATMPRIGTVDERYQSYNVEMLEVTGGKFWKPYGPKLVALLKQPAASASSGDTPAGMNPGLYQYR